MKVLYLKFLNDPKLNNDCIKEILSTRFPEFEIGSSFGHPSLKKNAFHEVSIRVKPHKGKDKHIDYIAVWTSPVHSGCLMVLLGYILYFIIRAVTRGSFYDDVTNVLTEELNARFQSIE